MALLRRLFARKALDGLLEISDRLYLFKCCLNTKTMGEDECRDYMTSIIIQLKNCYPNSSFMVLNLMEGDRRIQVSDILSQYNVKIVDYPRQYEGCPILPLETIHDFLRTSDSWLSSEGERNMLLLHCERRGWPVLAFLLASLLHYRQGYTSEERTLEMAYRQAPKELLHVDSPLNPHPSYLRGVAMG